MACFHFTLVRCQHGGRLGSGDRIMCVSSNEKARKCSELGRDQTARLDFNSLSYTCSVYPELEQLILEYCKVLRAREALPNSENQFKLTQTLQHELQRLTTLLDAVVKHKWDHVTYHLSH